MASPAHTHLDPHLPLALDFSEAVDNDTGDAYEEWVFFNDNHTNINWHSTSSDIPNITAVPDPNMPDPPYSIPSCWDPGLARLFYNMAIFARNFDSDDSGHNDPMWCSPAIDPSLTDRNAYNSFTGRIDIHLPPVSTFPTVTLYDGANTLRTLVYGSDIEIDNSSKGYGIYFYPEFVNFWTANPGLQVQVKYLTTQVPDGALFTFGLSDLRTPYESDGRFSHIPSSVLLRHHQPELESRAIGYTAALYEMFLRRTILLSAAAHFDYIDVSGGSALNLTGAASSDDLYSGGDGGDVDIVTGVPVDAGSGSGGDLTQNVFLRGGTYSYRQVPPDANVVITVSGNVTIYCQYVFSPSNIIGNFDSGTSPSLTVYAGDAVWIWHDDKTYGWPHGGLGGLNMDGPSDFTTVDFHPTNNPAGDGINGGTFRF